MATESAETERENSDVQMAEYHAVCQFTLAIDHIMVKKNQKGELDFCFTDGTEITNLVDG